MQNYQRTLGVGAGLAQVITNQGSVKVWPCQRHNLYLLLLVSLTVVFGCVFA